MILDIHIHMSAHKDEICFAGVATLDPETEEGKDYTMVNKAVWKLLSSWYCKDNKYEMCRKVIGTKSNLSVSASNLHHTHYQAYAETHS